MKKTMIWLVVVILLGATLGCLGGDTATPAPATQAPATQAPATQAPATTAPVGGNTVTLTVDNSSGQDVCYLFISPSTESTWGDDALGSDILSSGDSMDFDLTPGDYDIMATDCSQNEIASEYGVSITRNTTWTVSPSAAPTGPTVDLTVQNQSSEDICFLYVSPSTNGSWGDDKLGSDTLNAGDSFVVSVPGGTYDLKAEFCSDTDPVEEYGVDLTSNQVWTISN